MKYDVAIIGGGLAGLSLCIDLRQRGYSVMVIEKGNYPRHKVCGEYISMESHDYLFRLCPGLSNIKSPTIDHFKLSSTGSREYQTKLDLGGFGVSRYLLEGLLYDEAVSKGVVFQLKCKAIDIPAVEEGGEYLVKTNKEDIIARLVCNASGRRSNFEAKETGTSSEGTNYVGIKYHVRLERDPSYVEIHNFPGGYCGVSGIEDDKTCLCYLVNSKKLNEAANSIAALERNTLFQNPRLKKIFERADLLFDQPLAVSGINFKIKETGNDNVLFVGDSAGSIAPVTGNGMSMALRSASCLSGLIDQFFAGSLTRGQMMNNYSCFWEKEFSGRVRSSRRFQKLSEFPLLTNIMINILSPFPSVGRRIIRQTHGLPF